ncbi:MAG TPA: ABC transporter permease [Spirochaetia bacterium]|nr:ABC transporter permease [Spirochaetia bacterium]
MEKSLGIAVRPQMNVKLLLLRFRTVIALLVIIVIFAFLSNTFLTWQNILLMTRHVAINAFLAIGMTLVIVSGGIDLSVGSILGLCGMVVGYLIDVGLPIHIFGVVVYFHTWFIMLIALAAGALIGSANGLIITRLNVAPFIATLGMLYVARGLALLSNNGSTFPFLSGQPGLGNTGFPFLGEGDILGVPVPIWLLVVVALIAAFVASRTPFGRHIYAVGGNERAARLSGVRVNAIRFWVYVISGALAALSGLVVTSQLVAAHPASGETYELNAIAAAVLGGTSLMGGRGTIGGTIIGSFVIGILADGLVMVGVSDFWQMVIKGVVIIVAVAIDQLQVNVSRVAAIQEERRG